MGTVDVRCLEGAVAAGGALRASAVPADGGVRWEPALLSDLPLSLFSGTAGVIPFLLECHRATADPALLELALAGADALVPTQAEPGRPGLYTGLAGAAYVLTEAFRATGLARYGAAASHGLHLVAERARATPAGVDWPVPVDRDAGPFDVADGAAGIGLFLLHAARHLDTSCALDLALRAGRQLVHAADRLDTGLDWSFVPGGRTRFPNFLHGTAGIAYFLASLAMATGDVGMRRAAIDAGRHLQSIAWTNGAVALLPQAIPPRPRPGGPASVRYQLTRPHGPLGTAQTWFRLHQLTGGEEWMDWLLRSARAHLPGGIPLSILPHVTPVRDMCQWRAGASAEAGFLLDVFRVSADERLRERALERTDWSLRQMLPVPGGMAWPVRGPSGGVVVEPGLQGTAGNGLLMLYVAAALGGRRPLVGLPDDPFRELP